MTWKNVTLGQFLKLQEIMKIEDEAERTFAVAELLIGPEISDLSVPEFTKRLKELDFLKEEVPNDHIVKSVNINGRKYKIDAVLGHINTAQYVDFTNWSKDTTKIAEVLSVFFIPEGHKYNDGYDMMQVIQDMYDLPVDVALSESFFFSRQFAKFIRIFQSYSLRDIQKTNLPKEVKKNLKKAVTNSVDLVLSPLSSSSVK